MKRGKRTTAPDPLAGNFRNYTSALRTVVGYLILPNLVFWAASHYFDLLPRATFNIDYLLVGVLVQYAGFWGGVLLMCVAVIADVFRASGSLYYFSQRDAVTALAFAGELSALLTTGVGMVAMVLVFIWSSILLRVGGQARGARQRTTWMVASIVVLTSIGVWGGNSSLRFSDRSNSGNISGSSGLSMIKTIVSAVRRGHDRVPAQPIDSATRRVGWMDHPPRNRNIVLVLVESWGSAKNSAWQTAVTAPLRDPAILERYSVETGTVPFHGPTVPGEFRELCGVSSAVSDRPTDLRSVMERCLPAVYSHYGRTTLLHGFDGHLFDRENWSSRLGFHRLLFRHDLSKMSVRQCDGPFGGACDDDVARWIGDELSSHPQEYQMIYWLTLNSHLPVQKNLDPSNPLRCGTNGALASDEATCGLLGLIEQVHRSIAEVAKRPDLPETEFLLVGDHAPPFLYRSRRDQFSQSEVPYVHLIPKPKTTQASRAYH